MRWATEAILKRSIKNMLHTHMPEEVAIILVREFQKIYAENALIIHSMPAPDDRESPIIIRRMIHG